MTDLDDRTKAVERVAAATKALDPDAQRYGLRAVRRASDPLHAATSVEGMTKAFAGLIVMIGLTRTPRTMVTAFTALPTGTIGLFAPSPASGSAGGT